MTAPTHTSGQASLAVVALVSTYPAAALYPSESAFPGQGYGVVGLGAAVLSEALGGAALSTTSAGGAALMPVSTSVLVSA